MFLRAMIIASRTQLKTIQFLSLCLIIFTFNTTSTPVTPILSFVLKHVGQHQPINRTTVHSMSSFLIGKYIVHTLKGLLILGRGPLGQKVAKNAFSWHPSGEHLGYGLFERYIGILLPKKVPKRKTCQILRKRVICDYFLLNCYSEKKSKF